jgi:hypothetical protein
MLVIGGPKAGLLFAISPRTLGTIEDGLSHSGWKSVVVSGLEQPEAGAMAYPASATGGMSFMEEI